MRFGIFAKTFPGELPLPVLSAARDAGYDCVQWNMACSGLGSLPMSIPETAVDELRAAVAETGVGLAAVSATYNMIHPDIAVREEGRAAFDVIAAAAPRMGTDVVTVCTGSLDRDDQWRHYPGNASPETWAAFLAEMRLLLDLADRHDVTVGVEPETANVVSSALRAREMLDLLDHPRLGIVLDPANLFDDAEGFRGGAVIDEALDLLGPRIVMAHAKDRDAAGRVVPTGRGIVAFPRFLARLREAGFDGPVVTHGLSAEDAPEVARTLRAALG